MHNKNNKQINKSELGGLPEIQNSRDATVQNAGKIPCSGSITMMELKDIIIDSEAQDFYSRSPDRLTSLKESIAKDGFRSDKPLILAQINDKRVLADGYTRYEAACACALDSVPVIIRKCHDRSDMMENIVIKEQVLRRNMTTTELIRTIEYLFKKESLKASKRMRAGTSVPNDTEDKGRVSDIIGHVMGMSGTTVNRVLAVIKSKESDILQRLKDEKISISAAYNELREPKAGESKPDVLAESETVSNSMVSQACATKPKTDSIPPYNSVSALAGAPHFPPSTVCSFPVPPPIAIQKDAVESERMISIPTTLLSLLISNYAGNKETLFQYNEYICEFIAERQYGGSDLF